VSQMWAGVSRSPAKLSDPEPNPPFPARRGRGGDGAVDQQKNPDAKLPNKLAKTELQLDDGRYLLAYGYGVAKPADA
jgi:hypothetical protein